MEFEARRNAIKAKVACKFSSGLGHAYEVIYHFFLVDNDKDVGKVHGRKICLRIQLL